MNKDVLKLHADDHHVKFPIDVQFHAACSNSDLDEVKDLLAKGVNINVPNADGLTVLHQACIDNNLDVVKFLLLNGADVNAQDNEGWTPLHACASCSYTDLAELLIDGGASAGIVSCELELPLDVAEGVEMTTLLKDCMQRQSIDDTTARSAEERLMLQDALNWLSSDIYQHVVDQRTGATALHIAAAKGYCEVLEVLLQLPDVDVNATDIDGWTPLHAAAHWAKEEPLRLLSNAGASFDSITLTNQSIFDVAHSSVTLLLRQLREAHRIECQRAADHNPDAPLPPVVSIPQPEDAGQSTTKRESIEEVDHDEAKPTASKVAKRIPEEEEEEEGVAVMPAVPQVVGQVSPPKTSASQRSSPPKSAETRETESFEELLQQIPPLTDPASINEAPSIKVEKDEEKETTKTTAEVVSRPSCLQPQSPPPPPPPPPISPPAGVAAVDAPKKGEGVSLRSFALVTPDDLKRPKFAGSSGSSDTSGVADGVPNRRISAVLAPARSTETEAQRSSKARLLRSTRRSTQTISADVLEEVRRLSSCATPSEESPNLSETTNLPSPIPVQTRPRCPSDVDEPLIVEPRSTSTVCTSAQASSDVDEPPLVGSPQTATTTHVSRAIINPKASPRTPSPGTSSRVTSNNTSTVIITPALDSDPRQTTPSTVTSHIRGRRAVRVRVPTGRVDTDEVIAAINQLKQTTNENPTHSSTSMIPRPTARILQSVVLSTNDPSKTIVEAGPREPRVLSPASLLSYLSVAPSDTDDSLQLSAPHVSSRLKLPFNRPEMIDYRRLYEEERVQKEELKRILKQLTSDVTVLRTALAHLKLKTQNYDHIVPHPVAEIHRLSQENAVLEQTNKSLMCAISDIKKTTY